MHPALLDTTVQAAIGCNFSPGNGQLWTLFLPTDIKRITVHPLLCQSTAAESQSAQLPIDAWLSAHTPARGWLADITLFAQNGQDAFIQVEGLHLAPITEARPADDRLFFRETVWCISEPDGDLAAASSGEEGSGSDKELAIVCERLAYYYWRKFCELSAQDDAINYEPHYKQLLGAAGWYIDQISSERHPYAQEWSQIWQNDDETTIAKLAAE